MAGPEQKKGNPAPAQSKPKPKQKPMKVRAIETGYYDYGRRRPGDVFIINGEQDFSSRWMEKVPMNTPERVTGSQDEINRQHDEILAARAGVNQGGDESL